MRVREHHRRDFVAYLRWDRLTRGVGLGDQAPLPRGRVPTLRAFANFEGWGRLPGAPRHPRVLRAVLRGKRSLNLHVRLWAEGWADCGGERWLREAQRDFPFLPSWVWGAVKYQVQRRQA